MNRYYARGLGFIAKIAVACAMFLGLSILAYQAAEASSYPEVILKDANTDAVISTGKVTILSTGTPGHTVSSATYSNGVYRSNFSVSNGSYKFVGIAPGYEPKEETRSTSESPITLLLQPDNATELNIPDYSFRLTLQDSIFGHYWPPLGISRPITANSMKALFYLQYSAGGEGGFGGLTALDLGVLQYATELRVINMYNTPVTNFSALSTLTKLIDVRFSNAGITSIAPLIGNVHLNSLQIDGNDVTDLSLITSFPNLTGLYAKNNRISILPAAMPATLSNIDLSKNRIQSLAPFSNLTALYDLDLGHNLISDATLTPTSSLKILRLHDNAITSFPAHAAYDLITLDLSGNAITNVTSLSNLKTSWLHLNRNPIADASPLSVNPYITLLHMDDTLITSLQPFVTMAQLYELSVRRVPVSLAITIQQVYYQTLSGISNLEFYFSSSSWFDIHSISPSGATLTAWQQNAFSFTYRLLESIPDWSTSKFKSQIEVEYNGAPAGYNDAEIRYGEQVVSGSYAALSGNKSYTNLLSGISENFYFVPKKAGTYKIQFGIVNDNTNELLYFVSRTYTAAAPSTEEGPIFLDPDMWAYNATDTEVSLDWMPAYSHTGVASYRYSLNGESSLPLIHYEEDGMLFATISGLSPGLFYTIQIIAVDQNGKEGKGPIRAFMTTGTAVPMPLSYLSDIQPTSVRLNWYPANPSDGIESYKLYKNGILTATVSSTASSYTFTGLQPLTNYSFAIKAVNASNHESMSYPYLRVTPPIGGGDTHRFVDRNPQPGVIQGVVRWIAPLNIPATQYRVYRNHPTDPVSSLLGSVTGTPGSGMKFEITSNNPITSTDQLVIAYVSPDNQPVVVYMMFNLDVTDVSHIVSRYENELYQYGYPPDIGTMAKLLQSPLYEGDNHLTPSEVVHYLSVLVPKTIVYH